ncbi:MAG: helicase-associated domain-containing protein [Micromonosporaceae bacterium]|nr:helicase-associated domain-containing protein [Micromonosporaceae bacterium]
MSSTLTDHLRSLPDDGLALLIRLRPDLVVPVPSDFAALAARASSRVSVGRALDGLDRFTLNILDALRMTCQDGAVSVPTVLEMAALSGVPAAVVLPAIDALRQRCLLFGNQMVLSLVATVEEVCSPYLAGLGRPAASLSEETAALVSDPAGLRRTLMSAPPPARAALDRLAAGPPIGTVSPQSLARGSDSAVRWLVDARLLVQVSEDVVELPREVGLLLRREAGPLGPLEPDPPAAPATTRDQVPADRAAAGQAMETVRNTEALLEDLSAEPAATLRSGGIGVRDLRRLARACGTSEQTTALLVEVAVAAGLLAESSSEIGYAQYLPTVAYDGWRAGSIATRWLRLVTAWISMRREPSLVGQRGDRRIVNALSGEVERSGAPSRRRAVVAVLAAAPPGTVLDPSDIVSVLAWRAPRKATKSSASAVATVLQEAAQLGLTGLGTLSGYARLLLADQTTEEKGEDEDPLGLNECDRPCELNAVKALDELLPAPVEHILVQADLTVVVPGPPEPALATELSLMADQESPSVFRITSASVRRALDTGFTSTDLQALLAKRSRTPIPQPVAYLIDDVARQHGGLRVGSAGSFVHSDDETLITEVMANRRMTGLVLRRLAPTVVTASCSVPRLMAALRDAGYAPVAEDATGDAVLVRPRLRRASARPAPSAWGQDDPLAPSRWSAARLEGIIDQIRRGDAAARIARRAPEAVRNAARVPGASTQAYDEAMAVLQQAIRDHALVWLGYVDAHGTASSRLLRPVSMGGGYLRAEDERTATIHTFALHRITAAAVDTPEGW